MKLLDEKRLGWCLGLSALLVLSTLPIPINTTAEETSPPVTPFSLSGPEIPFYNLVSQFFAMAMGPCKGGTTLNCNNFLRGLGIEPGSMASQSFHRALDEFVAVRFGANGVSVEGEGAQAGALIVAQLGNDLLRSLPREQLEEQLPNHERESARRIGEIYGQLAKDLEAEGLQENLDRFLVEAVARNSVLHSSEPFGPEHPARQLDRVFTEAFDAVKGEIREDS